MLNEAPYTTAIGARVTDIAAHEFFHVVTPLNLHSEIIEHFNFETPVPSEHLWLYEGTTEWAADKMQLESGLKMPDAYLNELVGKLRFDRLRGAEHPPAKEYYAKLGFNLIEDEKGLPVRFEVNPNPTPEQLRLRSAWLGRPSVVP